MADVDSSAPDKAGLREDQIGNAVAFLQHPKVRNAEVSAKKDFLKQKGLTEDEIEEAFRRAAAAGPTEGALPAPAPALAAPSSAPAKPWQQPSQIAVPPAAPAPAPAPAKEGRGTLRTVLGLAVLGGGLYGLQRLVQPYVTEWIQAWRDKRRAEVQEKEDRLAKIAERMSVEYSELHVKLSDVASSVGRLAASLEAQGRSSTGVSLSDLRQELRTFAAVIQDAAPSPNPKSAGPLSSAVAESRASPEMDARVEELASRMDALQAELGSLRASVASAAALGTSHSNAASPSGWGQRPGPNLTGGSERPSGGSSISLSHQGTPAADARAHPAQQLSYQDILDMVQRGETPPNIRKDIVDSPPDPSRPLPPRLMALRPKPWQASSGGGPGAITPPTPPPPAPGPVGQPSGSAREALAPGPAPVFRSDSRVEDLKPWQAMQAGMAVQPPPHIRSADSYLPYTTLAADNRRYDGHTANARSDGTPAATGPPERHLPPQATPAMSGVSSGSTAPPPGSASGSTPRQAGAGPAAQSPLASTAAPTASSSGTQSSFSPYHHMYHSRGGAAGGAATPDTATGGRGPGGWGDAALGDARRNAGGVAVAGWQGSMQGEGAEEDAWTPPPMPKPTLVRNGGRVQGKEGNGEGSVDRGSETAGDVGESGAGPSGASGANGHHAERGSRGEEDAPGSSGEGRKGSGLRVSAAEFTPGAAGESEA